MDVHLQRDGSSTPPAPVKVASLRRRGDHSSRPQSHDMDREKAQAGEAVGDKGGKGCSQEPRVQVRPAVAIWTASGGKRQPYMMSRTSRRAGGGTCGATLLVVGPRAGPFAVFTFSLLVWLLLRSG